MCFYFKMRIDYFFIFKVLFLFCFGGAEEEGERENLKPVWGSISQP